MAIFAPLLVFLVTGTTVANPAGARAAASPQGGGSESNTQPTQPNWLFDQEKRPFEGDTLLVATTVRTSQRDVDAIVLNARVAHGVRGQALHRDERECLLTSEPVDRNGMPACRSLDRYL